MKKELAIIIPCYNNYELTKSTLESLSITTKNPYIVIIVDDNSNDNTTELKDKQSDTLVYIKNETNLGVNKSWNIGLKKAIELGSEFICIANNDLLFTQDWDAPLKRELENELSVVSPYSTERSIPKDFPLGNNRHKNPNPMDILGCCFMFKPSFITECGFFPEAMIHYYGDNWVCDIAAKKGFKVGYAQDSYIHHLYCKTTSKLPSLIFYEDTKAYHKYCTENNITRK